MIEIDGAIGGGQVLRSALALAMITGQPFRMVNIRARRPRPGLMRQHVAVVRAAARISEAHVDGDEHGATTLTFAPAALRGGAYEFAIGSAGSCTLLLQTVLPALLFANGPATVRVSGGTHNPLAPPAHFLQRAWLPQLAKMGVRMDIALERFGFSPAGGGVLAATVEPCARLLPLDLVERGEPVDAYAEAFCAGVSGAIAQRELAAVRAALGWSDAQLRTRGLPAEQGPGNVLLLTRAYAHVTEVYTGFGARFVAAEAVADEAVAAAMRHEASGAAVGEFLADQLMLPLALAGGGSFTCAAVTDHMRSNAAVIGRFLPVRFAFEPERPGQRYRVDIIAG